MTSSAAARWLLLAALWSLQHIFARVAVPVLGTGPVAELRALAATAFLVPWVLLVTREAIALREHWRDHLAVCMVNNVLPFVCFAYAATVLPASYLAVTEYSGFLWASALGWVVFHERVSNYTLFGAALIIVGCLVASRRQIAEPPEMDYT